MRMTGPLQRVLRVFLEDAPAPRYGYDLMRAAGVKSGTLYPLLGRLEEDGLVSSGWAVPQVAGQRPRRYYRLTGEGATVARVELARLSAGGRAAARPGRPAPGSVG
jgi:PadR family transcriptional regulator PadR